MKALQLASVCEERDLWTCADVLHLSFQWFTESSFIILVLNLRSLSINTSLRGSVKEEFLRNKKKGLVLSFFFLHLRASNLHEGANSFTLGRRAL